MESVGSSSTPPYHQNHRLGPTQPVTSRISRALRHGLRLLHRSDSLFFILGATGNVYTVNLSSAPSCTCPDSFTPCKHILFVLVRVLGVSLDETCFRRRTLRPWKLNRLLATPTSPEALAAAGLRHRFHKLFFQERNENGSEGSVEIKDGSVCPVCLEEMGKEERVVCCETCKNLIHEECWMRWKMSGRRRWASCVVCRSRWRDRSDEEKYLNLAPYLQEEDENVAESSGGGCLCGG